MPTKKTRGVEPKAKAAKTIKEKTVKTIKAVKEPKEPVEIKAEILEIPEVVAGGTDKKVMFDGEKYYEAVGRRKEAIARVRVYTKKSIDSQTGEETALIMVNGKPYMNYFNNVEARNAVEAPLKKLKSINRFKASVKVRGGGVRGQAEAVKAGLSRALVLFDPNFAKKLKKAGFLSRDARVKERRKYGLKKARKAPQWSKR